MMKNFAFCFEVLTIIIITLIIELILFTSASAQGQDDKQSIIPSFNTQDKDQGNSSNSSNYNSSASSFSGTIEIPKGSSLSKNGPFYLPENVQIPINSEVTW